MAGITLYNQEYLEKAKKYLELCEDKEIEKGTDDKPIYSIKVKIPTKGGLASYLGVHRDTLYKWSQENPEFSDIMEAISAEQEDRLINNGLSGDYNPTIAKVLLTKHGYREGLEQTGKDGKDLIPETLTEEEKDKLKALIK